MPAKKKRDQGQTIVRNMGLFWRRDRVRWRGNRATGPAQLTGKRHGAKRKGEVNFWGQTGIYALYDDYHLVYVGQAGLSDKSCLGNRLKQHLNDELADRWNSFSWFGLQRVDRDNELGRRSQVKLTSRAHLANVLEGILIEVAEPPMNSQKGRFGRRVERYLQVDDSIDTVSAQEQEVSRLVDKVIERVDKKHRTLARLIERVDKQQKSLAKSLRHKKRRTETGTRRRRRSRSKS